MSFKDIFKFDWLKSSANGWDQPSANHVVEPKHKDSGLNHREAIMGCDKLCVNLPGERFEVNSVVMIRDDWTVTQNVPTEVGGPYKILGIAMEPDVVLINLYFFKRA